MLWLPVNSREPALKHGLPSPESHQPSGTTQSVFTPHTSPHKHCCLLIEHHRRTNGRWCSWDLDTSGSLEGFFGGGFSQHALIEWFQWSLRVCLSPRGYYQRVCQPRLQSGSRGMSSTLIVGTGVWSSTEPPSVHLSRVSADPFLKNNHSLSSEEVPELIINKWWMLRGRGTSCGECRELIWGLGGVSVLLECSGWWSIRWAVKVDLTRGQRTDRCLGVRPNTDKRTPSGKARPVKQKKRGRVTCQRKTRWDMHTGRKIWLICF